MKRVRTVFTPEQLDRLEKEFLKQQYMVGNERVDLAATLHLTETQVGSAPTPNTHSTARRKLSILLLWSSLKKEI